MKEERDQPSTAPRPQTERFVVARVDEVPEGGRLIVDVGGRSVGIFRIDGEYYALLNRCPHLGGPLCEGPVMDLIESDGPGNLEFNHDRRMLTCPWHGWEFDIRTGESYVDPRRMRARRYKVEVQHAGEPEPARSTKGPYTAETIPISVEDDYLVVIMRPGAAGPLSGPARGSWNDDRRMPENPIPEGSFK